MSRCPEPCGTPARETPIHLITNEQAYKDVRASVMGGLQLGEEDCNPKEPVS